MTKSELLNFLSNLSIPDEAEVQILTQDSEYVSIEDFLVDNEDGEALVVLSIV